MSKKKNEIYMKMVEDLNADLILIQEDINRCKERLNKLYSEYKETENELLKVRKKIKQ